MLKDKKAIVLGDRDGIPGPSIAKCLKAAGVDVIFSVTECFVWTAAGAMDPENQSNIKNMVDQYGAGNLVIVLGAADMESAEITAETVISGDPSFSGPLAGVSLGLPVYHILEPEVKENIPEEVFREQLGMMEMVIDGDAISRKFRKMREEKWANVHYSLEDPIKNKYIVWGATNSYGTVKPQMEAGISGFSLSTQRKDVNLCVKFQALRSWVTKSLILPILGKSQNAEKIKESIAKYKTNIEALFKELGYLK